MREQGLHILTGPPSAGINAFRKDFSKMRKGWARIDVEPYKWLINHPNTMPWESEEGGKHQLRDITNACFLAKRFLEDGYPVLILELLTKKSAQMYRKKLESFRPKIIQLLPSYAEVIRCEKARGQIFSREEILQLYKQQKEFDDYDVRIDSTNLSALEIINQISNNLTIDIAR